MIKLLIRSGPHLKLLTEVSQGSGSCLSVSGIHLVLVRLGSRDGYDSWVIESGASDSSSALYFTLYQVSDNLTDILLYELTTNGVGLCRHRQ